MSIEDILFFLLSDNNPLYFTISGFTLIILGIIFDLLRHNNTNTDYVQSLGNASSLIVDNKLKEDKQLSESTLSTRLSASRNSILSNLSSIFTKSSSLSSNKNQWLESFEEILIRSDLGVKTSKKLIHLIKDSIDNINQETISSNLKIKILEILKSDELPEILPQKVSGLPKVILVVGVNGAGKTTTIGKLAFQYKAQGAKVLIAACDTFRAAAAEQLEVWKDRASAELERGNEGEKPSTVAYRAIHRAKNENFDILLVDTAGRLHTRSNLMKELGSITSIISKEQEGAPHETILVVDGSSGQNALMQAREFNEVAKLSGVVITKLDGTPKGGIVIAIKDELDIPIRYIGIGESPADLVPFDAEDFVNALFESDKKVLTVKE
jgi:fused signal recognition particle receptor